MVRSQARSLTRTGAGGRRLTLALLVAVVVVGGMPLQARAALVSGGGGGPVTTGNGKHNRNAISVNSPEENFGIQHITNTNAGGGNNTQASFCKWKFRHCRISQRQFSGW